MKRFVLGVVCGMGALMLSAEPSSFLLSLVAPRGGGEVRFFQDARLPQRMTALYAAQAKTTEPTSGTEAQNAENYITIQGYRVQIFSSNTAGTARASAQKVEADVREKLANVPVYVSFASPFWKVRIGDCASYAEAVALLHEARRKLADQTEFYIVKEDNIRVSLD